MMKLLCVLVFVACANALSYRDCDNSSPIAISIKSLPDPVIIKAGSQIPLKASLTVRSQLPARMKVHVKAYKKTWFWYTKLPCISNVGSCTYDLDCSALQSICGNCGCPFPAGQYNVDQSITVPSISIPSFLANGKYKVNYEVRSTADNSRVACGELIVSVKK